MKGYQAGHAIDPREQRIPDEHRPPCWRLSTALATAAAALPFVTSAAMLGSGSVSQLVIHSSPLVEAASMTAFSAGVISLFCSGVLAARKARSTYARMAGGN
jgi:hypothetical protein